MIGTEIEHSLYRIREKLLATARAFTVGTDIAVEAEDIVQDALAELWALREDGYHIRDVEALAVKITKATCVRYFRQRKIRLTTIEGCDVSCDSRATEAIDMQECVRLRQRLFDTLTPMQRQCLELRTDRQMSLDEIALSTGHPKASVKASISQARKKMYEQLKRIQDE